MSMRLRGDPALEWRNHWLVVLAATSGVAVSTINVYSAGLFIAPFEREFGWTRAQISFGPVLPAITTVMLAPFMGAAIDRFGSRRVGIIGVSTLICMTALLSLAGPSIWSWWMLWTLLAIVNVFIQPTVWTSAVSGFFAAGRGLALAVTLSGSGIGSLLTPILTYRLIEHYGWRMAFVGLAVCWGTVVTPLVVLFFTSVRDRERAQARQARSTRRQLSYARGAGRDALLSLRFIQLAAAGFLIATVVVSLAVSLVPILAWSGLDRGQAASIAAMLGIASITGRLTIGYLLDRVEGRFLAAFSVCLPILSGALLIAAPSSAIAASCAVLILGLALGAELDLVAYLTSRYFRLENFGLLFGTIGGLITLAGGAGPWVISLVYDHRHSYLPVLWAISPICLISATLFLLLGPYPTSGVQDASEPARSP
jgi:MFS family permease